MKKVCHLIILFALLLTLCSCGHDKNRTLLPQWAENTKPQFLEKIDEFTTPSAESQSLEETPALQSEEEPASPTETTIPASPPETAPTETSAAFETVPNAVKSPQKPTETTSKDTEPPQKPAETVPKATEPPKRPAETVPKATKAPQKPAETIPDRKEPPKVPIETVPDNTLPPPKPSETVSQSTDSPQVPVQSTPESVPPASEPPHTEASGKKAVVTPEAISRIKAGFFRLVNAERSAKGLGTLKESSYLSSCAKIRSKEIKACWSHTRPDNTPFYTVVDKNSYPYRFIGENIGMTAHLGMQEFTQDDLFVGTDEQIAMASQSIFDLFKNSPPHYENMLEAAYEECGIGIDYMIHKETGMPLFTISHIFAEKLPVP